MSCLTIPALPIPVLPAGITIPGLALTPPGSFDLNLCCKLPPIKIPLNPISIPPTVLNPAIIATLNGFIQQLQTYLHSVPLDCPLE